MAELWDQDAFDSEELLEQLADASLLELDLAAGEVRLHDVLRAFLGETLGPEVLRQAHHHRFERWGDVHQLPDAADPPYAWRWIGYHLKEAGRQKELDGLLQDLPWLQGKLEETGIAALGGRLASGAPDLTIQLWNPATGGSPSNQLLFGGVAVITALAFLSGASILVAGDASGGLQWLRWVGRRETTPAE